MPYQVNKFHDIVPVSLLASVSQSHSVWHYLVKFAIELNSQLMGLALICAPRSSLRSTLNKPMYARIHDFMMCFFTSTSSALSIAFAQNTSRVCVFATDRNSMRFEDLLRWHRQGNYETQFIFGNKIYRLRCVIFGIGILLQLSEFESIIIKKTYFSCVCVCCLDVAMDYRSLSRDVEMLESLKNCIESKGKQKTHINLNVLYCMYISSIYCSISLLGLN